MTPREQVQVEQVVIFELAGERYGVDIGRVQEINRVQNITIVPHVPPWIVGIINLRGKITPLIDLRLRFGLSAAQHTERTRLVVIKTGDEWVGVVVDAVSHVLRIPPEAIAPPAALAAATQADYLRGIARLDDGLLFLLNLDRALNLEADSVACSPVSPQAMR